MGLGQRREDLRKQRDHPRGLHGGAALDEVRAGLADDELEGDVEQAIRLLAVVMQRDDGGVAEAGDDLGLAEKPPPDVRVDGVSPNDLQGHLPTDGLLDSAVDGPEAAFAEQADDRKLAPHDAAEQGIVGPRIQIAREDEHLVVVGAARAETCSPDAVHALPTDHLCA